MKDRHFLLILLLAFVIINAGIVAAGGLLYWNQQDHLQTEVEQKITAVPYSPWFLMANIDAVEVYAPMRKWLWLMVFLMGVLLFGAAVTVRLFWRRQQAALYREKCEAEQKYRAIIEASADGILMADVETKMLQYPNPALCRMLGYTEQELNKMTVADMLQQETLHNSMAEFERLARDEGKGLAQDIPCLRKDGTVVYADINTTHATIGGLNCLVGVFRDITERKQAEEVLREREEWYRTLFVEALDGICLVDAKTGLIIECNQALTALVVRDKAELIGQPQTILHPPTEDNGQFSPTFTQHLGDRAGEVLDTQVVTRTGEIKEVAIRARTLNLAGKTVMQGLFRDITDRKRIEEQALIFRRFAEASGQGLGMATLQGQILYWNQTLCSMFEEDNLEDVYKKEFFEYYPPEFREQLVNEILPKVMSGGQWVGELTPISFKGKQIPTIENIFLIRDDEGRPLRLAVVITDITEQKQMEDELRKAKDAADAATRAKSEFLANMSHEIRTPMTAILGYAEIMFNENLGSTTLEHVAVIKRNAEHLLGLINDILDISKIEAGKLRIELTRCSPVGVVSEVVSLMRMQAAAKQLELKTEFNCPLPESVLTDTLRLRQMLVNLLGNAIKFTKQGEVRLAVRLIADSGLPRLRFDVTDTGIGMNAEQVGKLFQAFSQADSSTTRKFGGTGLGLYISKYLAEALGGNIEVQSNPGKGSAFILTIDPGPLEGIQMINNVQESQIDSQPTTTGTIPDKIVLHGRILLAEDGLDNQRLICLLLSRAGADMKVVENGQLAVEAALAAREAGEAFDVILMDMQMPVMDGYTATQQLRERDYTGPIIALTAHAMTENYQQCLDAGCNDYAAKPIDRQKLLEIVAPWVALGRTHNNPPLNAADSVNRS